MSAVKPQRNKITRLYLQLIAPLKTANVPEPFRNMLKETEIISVQRNRKEKRKLVIRELAVMQNHQLKMSVIMQTNQIKAANSYTFSETHNWHWSHATVLHAVKRALSSNCNNMILANQIWQLSSVCLCLRSGEGRKLLVRVFVALSTV